MKTMKTMAIAVAALALAGCQGTSAQTQEDLVKLRMAAVVLKYVDTCKNKSAPQYYVDKANQIWNAATTADQEQVLADIAEIKEINQPDGNATCRELGLGTRFIIASDFKIPEKSSPQESKPPQPIGLSAKITRVERSGGGYFYPLIVVENQSSESYDSTRWSCTFYDKNNEPVHEDTFSVKNVAANTKTASKSISHTNAAWETIGCRLLSAHN